MLLYHAYCPIAKPSVYFDAMNVRVRYAPSPTGLQHIGGVRTALFNYFFAKSHNGVFYLRIEDTDQGRLDERAIQDIYDTFAWLGIKPDEGPREGGPFGPYVQSERIAIYREYAQKLLDSGHAYRCFCTSEELEAMRAQQTKDGLSTGYDRRCRKLDPATSAKRAAAGERHVIRFAVPYEGETTVKDVLLGDVVWPNKSINPDPVIMKADGFPTYHLAHPVDDHLMQTSHVLRGQEWLPSAPLHVLIFQAFGWTAPLYCHLSVIMGQDGHKLSKRHGSTSAQEFRLGGYLPEAIMNYITLLGWSFDGETEIFPKSELERLFSLEKLSKSPAVFDYQKLEHFNAHWIRQTDDAHLAALLLPWLQKASLVDSDNSDSRILLLKAIPIARERLHKLSDAPAVLGFLFKEPPLSDLSIFIPKKQTALDVSQILAKLLPEIDAVFLHTDEENEAHFHDLSEKWGVKLGQVLMPLRLAVTGSTASPPLIASIRLLGPDETKKRVQAVLTGLSKQG